MAVASVRPASAAGPVRLVVGVVGAIDQPLVTHEIEQLQYPTLTALAVDTLETIPGVADTWTPAPGGWTYTVRAGALWSDGRPVTSGDVAFSIEQRRDEFPGRTATVVDERTITITGSEEPALLVPILPEHAYATDPGVAGGSWRVVTRDDDQIVMQVVDRPGRPPLDEIVFRAYPDTDALVGAIAAGDVDIAGNVDPVRYDDLRAVDGATAIHAADGDQWLLQLRIEDATLRRALARMIDREALAAEVANGAARTSPIPVVARAERWRLDADAVARVAPRLSYDPGASRVNAQLSVGAPDDDTAQQIADFVAAALTDAGIDVESGTEEAADVTVVRRDPGDDPAVVLAQYRCDGDIWCDPRYETAYEDFAATRDPAVRIAAVQTMVELLASEAVEVVLFTPDTLQSFRTDNVTGFLREPADERLVAFWPSVQQYSQIVPTATLGGEDIPDIAVAAIGVVVLVATGAVVVAVRLFGRRKLRTHSQP
jgi:peptide/nickel transport system substrate-binding protein